MLHGDPLWIPLDSTGDSISCKYEASGYLSLMTLGSSVRRDDTNRN